MTGLLAGAATLVAIWLGAAIALAVPVHRPPPDARFDALVVAGAAVRADGRPSGALARRTEHAVALWRAGVAPKIVLTGGNSASGGGSEGVVAARHASSLGVPDDQIVVEDRSTSTEENALGARRLLGPCRVLVVTDNYHALRCRLVFARHFPEVGVATTRPPGGVALRLALREVAVLVSYAVRGRLAGGGSPRTGA